MLAALRHETVEHYAVPRAFARCVNRSQVPAADAPGCRRAAGGWPCSLSRSDLGIGQARAAHLDHHGFYAKLYPHWLLIGFYSFFSGLAMLAGCVGMVRFWRAMKAADEASGGYKPAVGIVPSVLRTLTPIFSHDKFGQVPGPRSRGAGPPGRLLRLRGLVPGQRLGGRRPVHDQSLLLAGATSPTPSPSGTPGRSWPTWAASS